MPPAADILNDPDIAQAYEDVRSDKSDTTWLILKVRDKLSNPEPTAVFIMLRVWQDQLMQSTFKPRLCSSNALGSLSRDTLSKPCSISSETYFLFKALIC